jgi:hypothetical protein
MDSPDNVSNTSSASSADFTLPDVSINSVVIDVHNNEDVELGNIQEENCLIQYTTNHFTNVSNNELHRLRNLDNNQNLYIRRDSPMTISNYGSRTGSSSNSDDDDMDNAPTLDRQLSIKNLALSSSMRNNDGNTSTHTSDRNTSTRNNDGNTSTHTNDGNTSTHTSDGNTSTRNNNDNTSTHTSDRNTSTHNKKHRRISKFKQLAYHDVEKTLDKYYDMELDNKYSSELDILTTFMKGQKNVYIQAKYLSQWRFNCLIIPSLIVTCGITVLSPVITCNSTHAWIISGLNAFVGLFLSLINFLKLESSTTMYLQLANHYDKMETSLEMTNSKLILMETENEKRTLVLNRIKDIEQKLNEMKEMNNLLLPAEIKTLFPVICHVNIFSFIKKLENHRRIMILKFKDIKNEIRFILHKWNKEECEPDMQYMQKNVIQQIKRQKLREQNRMDYLCEIKEKLKIELNEYRCAYSNLDEIFIREIKHAETQTNQFGIWLLCFWKQNYSYLKLKNINPVLDKFFSFLFVDE